LLHGSQIQTRALLEKLDTGSQSANQVTMKAPRHLSAKGRIYGAIHEARMAKAAWALGQKNSWSTLTSAGGQ
jgi:hypothetical protein